MLSKIRKANAIAVCALAVALSVSLPASAQNQAPEFSLRSVDGETVTSASLRGEVVVLAFGASWLPLTKNQMEAVKKLADQYAGRGVAVYWVSTESESPKSKNYASDEQLRELARKYKATVLRDPDGAVSEKAGRRSTAVGGNHRQAGKCCRDHWRYGSDSRSRKAAS